MNLTKLKELFYNQPKYRLRQAKRALFQNLIEDWNEAKVLPQKLREKLNQEFPLAIEAKAFIGEDGKTIKALLKLKDGLAVETVLIRHKDKRNSVCLSSQIGCSLACYFCATGQMGFKRNLEAWEIIEQVLFFARYLKKEKEKISNLVFMGMGEPFLNYQSVMTAVKNLNDEEGFNLGARHFSISTVGLPEGIKKLAKEKLQVNLAISLHASNNKVRSKLMPVNRKYSIEKILEAVDYYIEKTNRRVMFEYIMIKNINDSEKDAKSFARLMKKPLYFVNLISYNFSLRDFLDQNFTQKKNGLLLANKVNKISSGHIFQPSSFLRIKRFKKILEKEKITVTQRFRFGQEINAACGQLAIKNKN